MKIRLLIDARLLGGVETHVIKLCKELSARQYDCSIVFVRYYPNNVLYTLCEQHTIPFHVCKSYKELFSLIRSEKPDIIHSHGYKGNIVGRIIGLITRIPIVSTFHSGEKPVGRLVLYNFLDRWTSFISNNISVNKPIQSKLPFSSKVIPNFVTIPKKANPLKSKGPYNIYFIGRLSSEKGPLRFSQMAVQSQEDFQWHMVGTGPLLQQCQEFANEHIHFHGQVTNMDMLWQDVDILCITSTYEGLPLVLLEAMSRGIPVISFDVGSIKEVIIDSDYLIAPYDLEQMYNAIVAHFKKSVSEREMSASSAREKIKSTYSKEFIVDKIEAFYKVVSKHLE